jgi:hypothetical protein
MLHVEGRYSYMLLESPSTESPTRGTALSGQLYFILTIERRSRDEVLPENMDGKEIADS